MTKLQLRRYGDIKKEKEQLLRSLEELETALYYPKIQKLTGMPSAPSNDNTLELRIASHLALQDKYLAMVEEMAAEQLAIEAAIEPLDPTMRLLLRYRYIDGLKWEEVCVRLNYSWRQVHRLHSDALKQLRAVAES